MGNSTSYIAQTVFENNDFTLFLNGNPSFDKITKENQMVLFKIEKIRYIISSIWGKIIFNSGAIVLKHPRFGSSLQGLLYLIARDNSANPLYFISFHKSTPIIRVKQNCILSEANNKLMEDILNYYNLCMDKLEELNKLKKLSSRMEETFNSNYDFWIEELKKDQLKYYKVLEEFHLKSSENKNLIHKANSLVKQLVNMINHILQDISIFERKFREKNYSLSDKYKFEKINSLSKSNNLYKNQMKLFWDFTEEKKLHDFDHWNYINGKIKENRELIIENNPITITLNKELVTNFDSEIKNTRYDKNGQFLKEIKENSEENIIHEEGCIKEPINSIGFNKLNYNEPKPKLGLKNWLISLKQSTSLDEARRDVYPTCLDIILEKEIIVIGSNIGDIYLYDKIQGLISKKIKKLSEKIKCICYLNDEVSFLTGSTDGKLIRWFIDETEPMVYSFKNKPIQISSIVYTGNKESVFVSVGQNIFIFDLLIFQVSEKFKITLKSNISVMKLSEMKLITGHINGEINIIDYTSKVIIITYNEHKMQIKDICFLDYFDSKLIIACSKDKSIKLLSNDEKKLVKILEVSPADIYPVKLSYCYDSKTVIVCYNNGNFFTVDYLTGKKKYHYSKESKIKGCLYTGDSYNIIFGNVDGNIDVFSVK